ncbi:MAG: hypothetical protein AUK48_13180 [Oscillatoriales cyanobacterium CG2_30_44_21]|nr:MAG: hypothetical protein AUK48_13180 [Oscillatoriales cyanobacterium CG2_30_44_21]
MRCEKWHNLESIWRDEQYSDFVHDFWDEFLDKMLCGGLVKNYNDIISPAIAVYDEMIARNPNLPKDIAPAVITEISEKASNLQRIDLGVGQLDSWQEIRKENERQRNLSDHPEIMGGK